MEITSFRGMKPGSQLVLSFFVVLSSALIFSVLAILAALPVVGVSSLTDFFTKIDYNNPATINLLKYMQITQSISMFVIPPFIIAYLLEGSSYSYLQLHKDFRRNAIGLAFLLILAASPAINFLGAVNKSMTLPDFLSGIEAKMKAMEENANFLIGKFMEVDTVGGLLFNILMIAIVPALGEEFLFRGVFQKIFTRMARNHHWGIWISAAIFSAVHFQFYGFFPRMILGALFGYILVWSGSIWVPIIAHFINNTIGVLGLYMVHRGTIDADIEDIGASTRQLPIVLVSLAVTGWCIYRFYQTRKPAPLIEEENTLTELK